MPWSERKSWDKTISEAVAPFKFIECDTQIRTYGKRSYGSMKGYEDIRRKINDAMLILWGDKDKSDRYLWVVSMNITDDLNPTIRVKGDYSRVIDLMVDKGAAVDSKTENGWTIFKTRLTPGQGLLFELKK